ncbi:MAG: hypothetical protein FJ100_14235 [Deltaproteobacteria bacterium]|nr:hypothetical protein [Deltaproteobacteria bacterium]
MTRLSDGRLVLLAAEIRAECARVTRCVQEMRSAAEAIAAPAPRTLEIYGAAALLDSFYSGVEKVLEHVARAFDADPTGSGWHRELLEASALELPGLRPAVLAPERIRDLDAYLGFRHRFRHLYVFDLEPARLLPLLQDADGVWQATEADLLGFAERLMGWA